jgi:Ca-activated chloride channel family protein
MKQLFLISFLLFIVANVHGYNFLHVGDPRNSWWTEQGTIEEATLSVRPSGLFMEYGLYLTFSSRGTYWTSGNDSLEVVLDFELPENAIVHDSWLWIGNDIVRAKIMDKWTASSIYENIVKRRRDPSILSKLSSTLYELRVFPMAGNETRKVKITWLMPANWSKGNVNSSLPTSILNTSRFIPESFPVIAFADSSWANPQIVGNPTIAFTAKTDTTFGDYFQAIIPSSKFTNINIGFDSPVNNGYYLSRSGHGKEGVYQLALFPNVLFDTTVVRKAAILVDFDASNTTLTANEILSTLKNEMINNLNSRDSFNLMFSNLSILRYSNKWVAASKENIETAFSSLNNPLSSYSNMASLIGSGIDFVKSQGNDGKIILVSDADQYGEYQVANKLINDILALMDPKIQFHIADYQSVNYPYYYNDGQYYYGNSYFYSNLSRMTLGSFQSVINGYSVSDVISESFKYTSGSLNSFDLHTTVQSGFCYGRYTVTGENKIAYLNNPILQVGKYKGDFPFIVEISGEYKNELFSQKIEIQEENATDIDTIAEEIWTGQYIKDLESGQQRNDIINEIIYNSIENRVLSRYTSFLCLENINQVCYDCLDESELVNVNAPDINSSKDSITIYPNPFVENVTIELNCLNPGAVKELAIYTITGSMLYQFNVGDLQAGNNILIWNGSDSNQQKVKSGVYLLVYRTSNETKTIKLLKK